jgi:hypothetical protein
MEAKKKARREAEVEATEHQVNKETQERHTHNETATKVQLSQTPSASQSVGTGSELKARRTSMPARSTVPLPSNMENHFFISHCQSTGGDQANAIYLELERLGFACW